MAMKDRTKALAIPPAVKWEVAERDSIDNWPCCVYCGRPAPTDNPTAYSCAHYIARSQGGLGIVQNILTLCPACHGEYDNTDRRKRMRLYFKIYLKSHHRGWREDQLVYKKEGQP
jgi:hypothetical protein